MSQEYVFGIVPSPIIEVPTEKTCKSIFNPSIARRLLKMGNQIVDIKKDRENPAKTIFLFEVTEKFQIDFNSILKDAALKK